MNRSGSHRTMKNGKYFFFNRLDPPRGRPAGGGGIHHFLGAWGSQPPSLIYEVANFHAKLLDITHDALGGSAPAARASPGCDSAVLPVHNRTDFSLQAIQRHRNVLPPQKRQNGRKRRRSYLMKLVFQSTKNRKDSGSRYQMQLILVRSAPAAARQPRPGPRASGN
jgi:hypothetical protein